LKGEFGGDTSGNYKIFCAKNVSVGTKAARKRIAGGRATGCVTAAVPIK